MTRAKAFARDFCPIMNPGSCAPCRRKEAVGEGINVDLGAIPIKRVYGSRLV